MVVITHFSYCYYITNHPKLNGINQLFFYAFGYQELGQFVTVPPFLMPHWDDLNTGGDLMTMGWDHVEVSSFIYLAIWFQLLPGNAGNQLEKTYMWLLQVASLSGLVCLFSHCGNKVPSTSNTRVQGRSALHFYDLGGESHSVNSAVLVVEVIM